MKTLDDLYAEITNGSEELRTEAAKAAEEDKLAEFAAKYGVKTTNGEFKAFLDERLEDMGEISDDELESASGGVCGPQAGYKTMGGAYVQQPYSALLLGGTIKITPAGSGKTSAGKR